MRGLIIVGFIFFAKLVASCQDSVQGCYVSVGEEDNIIYCFEDRGSVEIKGLGTDWNRRFKMNKTEENIQDNSTETLGVNS